MAISFPTCYIVVEWQRKSGIGRDAVKNTWCYRAPDAATATNFNAWMVEYAAWMEANNVLWSQSMSNAVGGLTASFWYLPLAGPGPIGAPVYISSFTYSPLLSGGSWPSEVAITLSLEGNLSGIPEHGTGGARPASRRRNRKYLGPLSAVTSQPHPDTLEPEISPGFRTQILDTYKLHLVDNMAGLGWHAEIFSRKDWTTHPVENAWVDNAYDTQRRRGHDATTRTQLPV
jgi:hypothetical protein